MKIILRFSLLAFCVFTLASCNRVGPVTGSVFIVTRGGENVKLGLVKVDVIPAQSVLDYLSEKGPEIRKSGSMDGMVAPVIAGLPAGTESAVTDADGKFTVELPANKTFFLAAKSSRDVGNKTEEYFWLEYLSASRKESEPVLLSNNNLLSDNRLMMLFIEAESKTLPAK